MRCCIHLPIFAVVLGIGLGAWGCSDGGDSNPGGEFSIDAYPTLTNKSWLVITGKKPAGSAIQVDSVVRVAKGPETEWAVTVELSEGKNTFVFEPVDSAGKVGSPKEVNVTLDTLPPSVVSKNPGGDAIDVPLNARVTVVFSELIKCDTINTSVFTIQGVSAALQCSAQSTEVQLIPSSHLEPNKKYTVTLYQEVEDLANNAMADDVNWQFESGEEIDTTPPVPPTADTPPPPLFTSAEAAVIGGWKEKSSSVISNGVEIVPLDDLETWSYEFHFELGSNHFQLTSEDASGNKSKSFTEFSVTRTASGFSVDAYPVWVNQSPWAFKGTKPTGFSVWLNGKEAVAANGNAAWNVAAELEEGQNDLEFEARDPQGLSTSKIPVQIFLDTQPPGVLNTNPADGASDVPLKPTVIVVGSEPWDCSTVTDQSFFITGVEATVGCLDGDPEISLTPKSLLQEDRPYSVTVKKTLRDRAGNTLGQDRTFAFRTILPGRLVIEFDLMDMWDYLGDEMYFQTADRGVEFNHFGVDIWVEGPFQDGEACLFDEEKKQRLDTRYVATIVHGVNPLSCKQDPICDEWCPCSGWWDFTNYRATNYLAALVELGQWRESAHLLDPKAQRRDPSTGEQWAWGLKTDKSDVLHPEIYYLDKTSSDEAVCRAKMHQEPFVDGMTEATIDSGQGPNLGMPLGQWETTRTYEWNLTDYLGMPVEPGRYLIHVLLHLDRARQGDPHQVAFLLLDRETCWDNPDHDSIGPHRAEGMILIGGASPREIYLTEKSFPEFVDACFGTEGHPFAGKNHCDCQGSNEWPCPDEPIDPSFIGKRIWYMNPDKYVNPIGDNQNYAMKITYCPPGGCP